MSKDELYNQISKVLDRGNNAEIRKKPDGSWVVYEIKKHIVS